VWACQSRSEDANYFYLPGKKHHVRSIDSLLRAPFRAPAADPTQQHLQKKNPQQNTLTQRTLFLRSRPLVHLPEPRALLARVRRGALRVDSSGGDAAEAGREGGGEDGDEEVPDFDEEEEDLFTEGGEDGEDDEDGDEEEEGLDHVKVASGQLMEWLVNGESDLRWMSPPPLPAPRGPPPRPAVAPRSTLPESAHCRVTRPGGATGRNGRGSGRRCGGGEVHVVGRGRGKKSVFEQGGGGGAEGVHRAAG